MKSNPKQQVSSQTTVLERVPPLIFNEVITPSKDRVKSPKSVHLNSDYSSESALIDVSKLGCTDDSQNLLSVSNNLT